jgi:hypothetical protein
MTTTEIRPAESPQATLRPLLLDLAIPLGSYYLLRAAGVGLVTALAASSVWPAARTVAGVVRDRTVNGLALLIVVVNVASIAISFWSGDPRLMLAKDAAITSTIGIAILISAGTSRPTWPLMARWRCWTRMGRPGGPRRSSTPWPPPTRDRNSRGVG